MDGRLLSRWRALDSGDAAVQRFRERMAHAANDVAERGTFVHRRENRFRSLRGSARAHGRAGGDLLCEGVCDGISWNDSFAASTELGGSAALDDRAHGAARGALPALGCAADNHDSNLESRVAANDPGERRGCAFAAG